MTCVAGWFNHRRVTAFGVVFTGSSIGVVVFPIMVSHLIREVGYAWTMRISALLSWLSSSSRTSPSELTNLRRPEKSPCPNSQSP